jgi:hypothetical protein
MPKYAIQITQQVALTRSKTIYIQADNEEMADNMKEELSDQISDTDADLGDIMDIINKYPGKAWEYFEDDDKKSVMASDLVGCENPEIIDMEKV